MNLEAYDQQLALLVAARQQAIERGDFDKWEELDVRLNDALDGRPQMAERLDEITAATTATMEAR